MAAMINRGTLRYGLLAIGGVLLATSVLYAREPETVRSDRPIDFYYIAGQQEILVPFGNVQFCKVAYVGTHAGLVIDRVVADGQEVKPVTIKGGVLDGRWDLMLEKPGESFRYEVKLDALASVTFGTPFDGKSFPVAKDRPPRSVEIFYRLRCAGGTLSEEYVTRGVRLDFAKGRLATGASREPQESDDVSGNGTRKTSSGPERKPRAR